MCVRHLGCTQAQAESYQLLAADLGGVSTGCRKITVCSKVTLSVSLYTLFILSENTRKRHSVSDIVSLYCRFNFVLLLSYFYSDT